MFCFCVILVGLEVYTSLALSLQRSTCFFYLSSGIEGVQPYLGHTIIFNIVDIWKSYHSLITSITQWTNRSWCLLFHSLKNRKGIIKNNSSNLAKDNDWGYIGTPHSCMYQVTQCMEIITSWYNKQVYKVILSPPLTISGARPSPASCNHGPKCMNTMLTHSKQSSKAPELL